MTDRDGKRLSVYGMTGSGKTVFTQGQIIDVPRVVIFDPKRSYRKDARRLKLYCVDTLADLVDCMRDNAFGNFRVVYEPEPGFEAEELHEVSKLVERLQLPHLTGKKNLKTMLVVEEVHNAVPNPPSRKLNGFNRLVTMGREMGVDIITVTQQPQAVATYVRDSADRMACFKVATVRAATAAADARDGDPALIAAIQGLKDFEFVFLDGNAWKVFPPIPF